MHYACYNAQVSRALLCSFCNYSYRWFAENDTIYPCHSPFSHRLLHVVPIPTPLPQGDTDVE